MKFAVLVPLLFAILLFQSMWDIATRSCQHETIMKSSTQVLEHRPHFGHHSAESPFQSSHVEDSTTGHIYTISFDYQKHMVVYLLGESLYNIVPLLFEYLPMSAFTFGDNFYQSPDLAPFTPPPIP